MTHDNNELTNSNELLKTKKIELQIYPEILIVVDNKLHKKLGDKSKDTVSYILEYWNSVDIKYQSLKSPKYRLNIAGIVIEINKNQLTYLSDNIWKTKTGIKNIKANYVLEESGKFWYEFNNTIPFSSYDVLITMTLRKMCTIDSGDDCSDIIDGRASMEAACKIDHHQRELCKVGIITDGGNYQSINTAAHELGHLLGADHDDDNGIYKRCLPNHIMRSVDEDNRVNTTVYWTDCSKEGFKKFLT
ncbi:venom metalloproteinase 2-like [Aphidius gifuensis]|uniref:venom metalloproteinase 2-like n=1 Tax=Aphidius gifuensis TaxID=684658 RepID=UPI001CDC42F0|nr:venom metalloproteinase 2-like [Aphidius gifuensis]